ncbi:hypothetical protein BGZ63DRAFT_198432 [Mariannaea sp. PMI_226]|nr:hypothetical protein BGZ63DRAFT_198432 [Mariannaea sp. PMI_226]
MDGAFFLSSPSTRESHALIRPPMTPHPTRVCDVAAAASPEHFVHQSARRIVFCFGEPSTFFFNLVLSCCMPYLVQSDLLGFLSFSSAHCSSRKRQVVPASDLVRVSPRSLESSCLRLAASRSRPLRQSRRSRRAPCAAYLGSTTLALVAA